MANNPVKEFMGSTLDMKGFVFFTPSNNLTNDLIRKVDEAAVYWSDVSLEIFGRSRKFRLGKRYPEDLFLPVFVTDQTQNLRFGHII